MASASSIRDFGELENYGDRLVREAENLRDEYENIRRRVNLVANSWDDKSHEWLREQVEMEAKRIADVVEKVDRFGREVQAHAKAKAEINRRLRNS